LVAERWFIAYMPVWMLARRPARRRLGEMAPEQDAVPGQRIQMRGPKARVAERRETVAPPLIGGDEQDVHEWLAPGAPIGSIGSPGERRRQERCPTYAGLMVEELEAALPVVSWIFCVESCFAILASAAVRAERVVTRGRRVSTSYLTPS
jgi:hypothetical protein